MTLGVVLFVITLIVIRDHRVLQRFTYTSGLAAIVLLLLPLLPVIGTTINGAQIWIRLGPFSFQPGEVAKVLLVIAFAGYLVLHRDALALAGRRVLFVDLPRGRDLGPILAMWLISLGILVFQKDLGSSLLFFGLFLIMLYVATERPGWLVVGGLLFAGGAAMAYAFVAHVQVRFDIWRHPFEYYGPGTSDKAFQPVESMFGMGWGGLIGRGFGDGDPNRVPFANSDFIMSSIGEELGLTAVMAVIVDVRPDRRARPAHRADLPRRLRQAARHRSRQRLRAPGLRRHRRRHRPDPAHRSHHPVPLVRRLVADRQLGDHRAPAAHLRPGPAPGPAALRRHRRDRHGRHAGGQALMNKPIRTISLFCLVLFLALMLNATYLQYWKAGKLNDDPRNRRVLVESYSRERGAILVGRSPVAESVESDDQYKFQRTYPKPLEYAPITGWFSYFSQTGIER